MMKFKIAMVALLICNATLSQVGIGTITPDPTSILDITSTTQGLLAPRMTTVQRNAITTPANSLLVYDTDLKAFYYYDSPTTNWIKIDASVNQRDDYKLVKSAADLAPELTAGGGSKYLLSTNTYYEINGLITLAAPIDLNNAYLSGLDASEDILSSAGTVFAGSTGGGIRNITIAGGGTAFNITGGNSLLLQNTTISGMNSVGTISGVGLYFANVVQFVGNTNGVTYTNIGNLLLNNQGWLGNNSGTFETFTGTFGLIEKVSGFSTANGAAIALDVSSNPTVGNGVLFGTVFSGTTTAPSGYVNRYTVGSYTDYNFNNAWTVNCPGIPKEFDDDASGYMYFASENTTVTNVITDDTPVKMLGTTFTGNLFRMSDDGGTNNRLKYEGSKQRNFTVTASATLKRTNNGSKNVYSLIIYKNGSIVPSIVSEQTFENGVSKSNFTVLGTILLKANDYIEVYVSTDNQSIDPTVTRFNLVLE